MVELLTRTILVIKSKVKNTYDNNSEKRKIDIPVQIILVLLCKKTCFVNFKALTLWFFSVALNVILQCNCACF